MVSGRVYEAGLFSCLIISVQDVMISWAASLEGNFFRISEIIYLILIFQMLRERIDLFSLAHVKFESPAAILSEYLIV
jgi:hypothetical protein